MTAAQKEARRKSHTDISKSVFPHILNSVPMKGAHGSCLL
jgi:hypothetical protein